MQNGPRAAFAFHREKIASSPVVPSGRTPAVWIPMYPWLWGEKVFGSFIRQ